jgi:hypothetical protein
MCIVQTIIYIYIYIYIFKSVDIDVIYLQTLLKYVRDGYCAFWCAFVRRLSLTDHVCAYYYCYTAGTTLLLYRAALMDQFMRMKKGDILWHDHAVCW